jgi:predicted glutamine amidotransferase
MCRLFGLTAGRERVAATFWLLDAPDSLEVQSRRNADGAGMGFFDPAGAPVIDKQPVAAYQDSEFSREAKRATSQTFVAHVRWATAGGRTVNNTHPFAMRGLIMAHNGGFGELDRLDEQLGSYRDLVLGDTDSERYFALMIQQIDACGGDVGAGIAAAARWIGERLPVSSLNTIVAGPGELWALRYPAAHALHILERPASDSARRGAGEADGAGDTGGVSGGSGVAEGDRVGEGGGVDTGGVSGGSGVAEGDGVDEGGGRGGGVDEGGGGGGGGAGLHVRSATSSIHAAGLDTVRSVVIASEELDGEDGWRMLGAGELVHVRADLTVERAVVLPDAPTRLVPLPTGNPNIDT